MLGRARFKTRLQAQSEPTFEVKRWGGGQNTDSPASTIKANESALLRNAVDFGDFIEGRSGTLRLSSTALPGSGTVHALAFHPTTKKWALHRGTQIWTADAAISAWAEAKSYTKVDISPTVNGDASNQLSSLTLNRLTGSNSNAGTLYWTLTNSGTIRTLNVYKDSAKTLLVASGTKDGNGLLNLVPQNSSGLSGIVSVTYTTNDSDASNTLVVSNGSWNVSFGSDVDSQFKPFDEHFVLAPKNSGSPYITYLDLTNNVIFPLNAPRPIVPIYSSGARSPSVPYGYRYLYTHVRIVDSSGVPAYGSDRISGVLAFESASNNIKTTGSLQSSGEYTEFWLANPINSSTPHTIFMTTGGAQGFNNIAATMHASEHYTHFGVYRTLDIGTAGIDPQSGLGNSGELFIWCGDFPIGSESISVTQPDDGEIGGTSVGLRARLSAGFALKTRFWDALPSGEVFEITPGFMFVGSRGQGKLYYNQIQYKELAGYYHPAFQFMRFDDGLQLLQETNDQLAVICSNQTWVINPKLTRNVDKIASVFVLTQKLPASRTIGVTDWGSLSRVDSAGFIARCSDGSVRIWNGQAWGPDLGENHIRETLLNMVDGSAALFVNKTYLLWYRTSSGDAYNTKCLRLGLGGDAGVGWSEVTGAAFAFPNLRVAGAVMLDSNNLVRAIVLDQVTGTTFWVETFTNANASLTKAWKDKENVSGGTDIASTIRFREFVGSKESHTLYHEESHAYLRPTIPSDGYLSGFQVSLNLYADGAATAVASQSNAPKTGDIQLSKVAPGRRLQPELVTTTSKFQLIGYDAIIQEQDKATIGAQFAETDEAAHQLALASNLKHWLCRPYPRLNRANGQSYTLSGTAPTQTTGPDGKTFALQTGLFGGTHYAIADGTQYDDLSIHFWIKEAAGFSNSKKLISFTSSDGLTVLDVKFTSATVLSTPFGSFTVSSIASGFHSFWIIRSSGVWTCYQNGAVLAGTYTDATTIDGTTVTIWKDGNAVIIDDVRIYNAAKAAAPIAYYYDNVINNAGNLVLPLA